MKRIKSYIITLIAFPLLLSCAGDYMDTLPTSSSSPEELYGTFKNAKMAINGIARLMVNQYTGDSGFGQEFCGEGTIKFLYGEYTGENYTRASYSSRHTYMNWTQMDSNTSAYSKFAWYYYYALIGNANDVLYNIDDMDGTESEINFIKAQALVYRAYCYSQLIQFYCTRWSDNRNDEANLNNGLIWRTEENRYETFLPLSSAKDIYAHVYADLDKAITLFSASTEKRTDIWEPNINVAYAVYARAALTREDYSTAATMAAKARVGYPLMSNDDYKAGFSSSNGEWIWGSYGGDDQTLHYYGFHSYMAYDANSSAIRSYPVAISKELYDKIPAEDSRKEVFLDSSAGGYSATDGRYGTSHAVAKAVLAEYTSMYSESGAYRVSGYHCFKFGYGESGNRGTGFINHFRSAEMILIEAEAKYYLSSENDARSLMNELNIIRNAGYNCTDTVADLLAEIKTYRAFELWGEGFDWPDKKRYNEPIVRKSFKDGGNFHATVAGTFKVDYKNNWTYVTPLYESENNPLIGGN